MIISFSILAYVVYCFWIAVYAHFMPDAFIIAAVSNKLSFLTPYVDYPPFKNQLAKYILYLPSLLFSKWNYLESLRYLATCFYLANASLIFYFIHSHKLIKKEHYLALLLLFLSPTILETFYYVRIDQITNFFFFLGVFFFYKKNRFHKEVLAPLFFANSFLCSQKVLVLIIPFSIIWFFEEIIERKKGTVYLLKSILYFLIPLCLYIAYWSLRSDLNTVLKAFFLKTSTIKNVVDVYWVEDPVIWFRIIKKNIGIFLFALFGLTTIAIESYKDKSQLKYLIATLTFVILQAMYPVVYNYNMGKVFPVLLFIGIFYIHRHKDQLPTRQFNFLLILLVTIQLFNLSSSFNKGKKIQKHNYDLAQEISQQNPSSYHISGFRILFPTPKTPPNLQWIDRFKLAELLTSSKKELNSIFEDLDNHQVAFWVQSKITNNLLLNDYFANYFYENFTHFYGSIHTRSKKILATQSSFSIPIPGNYKIYSKGAKNLLIDGKEIQNQAVLFLDHSKHTIAFHNKGSIRIQFIPTKIKKRYPEQYSSRTNFFFDFQRL